jgi:hypothetical protein
MDFSKHSSSSLCTIIAAYRFLSLGEPIIIAAMKELAARRENNETFDFESKIEEELTKLREKHDNKSNSTAYHI